MRSRHWLFSKYAIIVISTTTIPICQPRAPAHNRLLPTTKLLIKCHDLLVAESRLKKTPTKPPSSPKRSRVIAM
jgi:hypothetical protein